ncbi:MAG: cadherin-like domain-containing protein, partial [Kiloniellaceae bacterium]
MFVTGQVAPSGGLQVETPVGVIGIRGTTVGVEIATLGGRTAIANLTNPETGETGSFLFSNNAGNALFSLANHYLEIRSINADPGVPRIASSQDILNAFGRPLSRAVTLQRALGRDDEQNDDASPTDQQEGALQGDVLQALQNSGPSPQQADPFQNAPVLETAGGPNQTGDGGTSVPSSGSGFGGGLQTEAVANTANVGGSGGANLGGASSGPLPSTGSAGTPPPPPGGIASDTQDDAPPPPPDSPPPGPTPPANTPPDLTVADAAGTEGAVVPLGAANLSASDAETADPAQLVYTVTGITNGVVLLDDGESVQAVTSFTQADVNAGRVFFSHDGGETSQASVALQVSDPNGGVSAAKVLQIGIAAENDAPVVVTAAASVAPGNAIIISTSILSAFDADHSDPAGITFTVSNLVDGEIEVAGSAVTSFTLAEVIAGQVSFVHDGGNSGTAGFSVIASDPLGASSAPAVVALAVASGFVWTNASGTGDWDDAGNWLGNAVPPAGSSVTIPNVGAADFSTGSLVVDSLHLAGGILEVTGGLLGTGAVDGESGTLIVDGGEFRIAASPEPTLDIGPNPGSLGNAMVQNGGELSLVGNGALLAVGREGNANTPVALFTISSGGSVLLDGEGGSATVSMGEGTEGFGAIFVSGEGSALSVEGSFAGFVVGGAGTGELLISDGGFASATYLDAGNSAGSIGVVAVGAGDDGQGSRSELNIAGQFIEGGGAFVQIGGAGTGALQVTNGALVSIDSAGINPRLVIGASTGGEGSVLVTGAGSELIVSNGGNANDLPFIAVGDEGDGTLIVLGGGEVVNAANGYTFVGLDTGGTGTVVVGGDSVSGSLFDAGAVLVIGAGYNFPNNQVLFEAGGTGSVTVG